jgi:hypothetical protein
MKEKLQQNKWKPSADGKKLAKTQDHGNFGQNILKKSSKVHSVLDRNNPLFRLDLSSTHIGNTDKMGHYAGDPEQTRSG